MVSSVISSVIIPLLFCIFQPDIQRIVRPRDKRYAKKWCGESFALRPKR